MLTHMVLTRSAEVTRGMEVVFAGEGLSFRRLVGAVARRLDLQTRRTSDRSLGRQ
jgi:hypothetical protein